MEEKFLIESERYNFKKIFIGMVVIGIVLSILISIISISDSCDYYDSHEHGELCYIEYYRDTYYEDYYVYQNVQVSKMNCCQAKYNGAFEYALSQYYTYQLQMCLCPVAILSLIGGIIFLWLCSYKITVTNKRIFCKIFWIKRICLPADFVSATGTIRILKGISVSTPSGRISFLIVKNAEEIYNVINNLLIERQKNTTVFTTTPNSCEVD